MMHRRSSHEEPCLIWRRRVRDRSALFFFFQKHACEAFNTTFKVTCVNLLILLRKVPLGRFLLMGESLEPSR